MAEGTSLAEIGTRPEFGSPWWLAFCLIRDSALYDRCCDAAAFPDVLADEVLELSDRTNPTPSELAAAIAWLNEEERRDGCTR